MVSGRETSVILTGAAAMSCSRADWGRRILSPGSLGVREGGAMAREADQVSVSSVASDILLL